MNLQALPGLLRPTPDLGHEVKRLNRLRVAISIGMAPVVVLIALFTTPGTGAALPMRLLGAVVVAAGAGLRLWALGSIDRWKKRVVVTWGPYRFVRHPLYLGSLLVLVGFCIAAGSWSAALLAALLFVALSVPAVRAEERLLAAQFGAAWESYRRSSGALLPRFARRREELVPPFGLRHPARELGVLALVFFGALGAAELVSTLRQQLDFAPWLF